MSARLTININYIFVSLFLLTIIGCSTSAPRSNLSSNASLTEANKITKPKTQSQNNSSKTFNEQAKRFQAKVDNKQPNRPSRPIKILPLGDSITHGGGGYPSYRRSLWFMLKDAGYHVDFIGSHREFIGYVPKHYIDFDLDHEGHWGWEAGEIDLKLGVWLKNYTPDIVLLHAGTNDFFVDQDNESTVAEISSMISKLRAKNPRVVILLAKLIPMRNKDTQSINAAIHLLGRKLHTPQSPIILVDQYSGFSAQADNHDNYHPNIEGEKKMARRWFYALTPYL